MAQNRVEAPQEKNNVLYSCYSGHCRYDGCCTAVNIVTSSNPLVSSHVYYVIITAN
jgi:hypothetical protein